jgi:hypothetical protein
MMQAMLVLQHPLLVPGSWLVEHPFSYIYYISVSCRIGNHI